TGRHGDAEDWMLSLLLLPPCLRASLLPFLFATSVTQPEAWWSGLDSPTPSAPARGVHALRAPVEGRARIAGTTFVMGSSPTDMVRAVMMCRREVLRAKCDDMASRFRAEGVAHEVTLSTFEIDRTEVRVADYQRCVAAGACAAAGFAPGDRRFDQPDLPV